MKLQFVNLAQARLLKSLGFNWPTLSLYRLPVTDERGGSIKPGEHLYEDFAREDIKVTSGQVLDNNTYRCPETALALKLL